MSQTVWVGTTSSAFATGSNWLSTAAPITGDGATSDGRMIAALTGSDQSAITLATLTQVASAAYAIGSSAAMLQIGATTCTLGSPATDGSNRTPAEVALNFGSVQNTTTVYASAASGTNQLPPILLKGSHASNKLTVIGGNVGVAAEVPGSTATYAVVNVVGTQANVLLESGCALTTINQDAGTLLLKAAATTITQIGGTATVRGSGALTTANVGGKFYHQGTGTITNLNVADNGIADFSGTFDAVTVTTAKVYGSGRLIDPNKRVTFTNPIQCLQGATSGQVDIGNGVTIQPA